MFQFNRVFYQYLVQYTADVEIVHAIKKNLVGKPRYAAALLAEEISFSGVTYLLNRVRHATSVADSMKRLLGDPRANPLIFELTLEILIMQVAREYDFCKDVLVLLLSEF